MTKLKPAFWSLQFLSYSSDPECSAGSPRVPQPPIISWEEQLHDHNQKIEEYLQNRVFRGCTYESTVRSARTVLKRLFDLVPIDGKARLMKHECGLGKLLAELMIETVI